MKKSPKKSSRSETFQAIKEIASHAAQVDGTTSSEISFLSFIRSTQISLPRRGILNPSFCLLVQGKKEIHIGKEAIQYGPGKYLVATVDMPTSGRIVGATKAQPYLGVRIELDPKEIADILLEAKIPLREDKKAVSGAFVGSSNEETQKVLLKILELLKSPQDAAFLGKPLKRELIYRLLTSEDGYLFYQNVLQDARESGIGSAIQWIKDNFARPLKMEQLAKKVNMSVSSLHHKFKAVTTMGPLQYQKQLRLQEARRLLLAGIVDASTAAYQVGYESHSQFSREYRRLFGAPPMQDIKTLRHQPKNPLLQD